MMQYENEIKEKAISLVRDGKSINETAKMLNVTPPTILRWCRIAGVKSRYECRKKNIPGNDIISIIKSKKVATAREIAEQLNATAPSISFRLRNLKKMGQIKCIRIPRLYGRTAKRFLVGYIGNTLYYISDKEFIEWFYSKLPKNMPKHLRKTITMILNDIGIKVEKPAKKMTVIYVPIEVKEKIQQKAKEENVSITDLIRKVLDD